ncbi:MAG: tetratricopeptide repeat protein, partial [Deltaproteobacteria bacterium]|nr:tetratricopeptide repeat protein [Deltaproteobacteria bacterium]
AELEGLDRESLVARAQEAGIRRARILTRPELIDELLRSDPSADEKELKKTRGFFGRARDLVARVVERGLHLPDAADRIRTMGTLPASVPRSEPQAVPTVTLAEIYAAQGHPKRAIATLKLVLDREPDHAAARALLAKLEDTAYVPPPPPLPPEPEVEPDPNAFAETEVDLPIVTPPPPADDTKSIDMLLAEYVDEPTEVQPPRAPRLERSECVARSIGGGRMFVRWAVADDAEAPELLTLRACVITPSWDGPTTDTRDVQVDAAEGDTVLPGIPPRAVVRVAIGFHAEGRFVPLAHSPAQA